MAINHTSWLVIGIPENWDTSLAHPIPLWGLKPHYSTAFQLLREGDVLWIYVTAPVKGIVGVGYLKDKYIESSNLFWPEECEKRKVIWPFRFRIHLQKCIARNLWESKKIPIGDFGLNWQIGFQSLDDKQAAELAKRSQAVLGNDIYTGATIVAPTVGESGSVDLTPPEMEKPSPKHRDLQVMVAEIGKLQYYHAELEYPIDLAGEHRSLDVVWKREVGGAPSFAFEVELSTGLEKAVGRLKFAYKRWNSRPRIIVPSDDVGRVRNILTAEEREFGEQLRVYEPSQLIDLLEKKKHLKDIEQELGIY